MELLRKLCTIKSPSGEEFRMTEFLLSYITKNKRSWKNKPKVLSGDNFQDSIILIFGKPRTAVYAHIDTVGFMVRYDKELVTIGSPYVEDKIKLVGEDKKGVIECLLDTRHPEYNIAYTFFRDIEPATSLIFKPIFRDKDEFIESNYLDNRIGVWVSLKLAEIVKDAAIVFTCGEEQKGGSSAYISKYLYDNFNIRQALIADVGWLSRGVKHGGGAIISRRDSAIPRKRFFDRIIQIAKEENALWQVEVEQSGSTDGTGIYQTGWPIDWCFIGAPVYNMHSPIEKIHKIDIFAMFYLFSLILKKI